MLEIIKINILKFRLLIYSNPNFLFNLENIFDLPSDIKNSNIKSKIAGARK
jgi:hypothetical protein